MQDTAAPSAPAGSVRARRPGRRRGTAILLALVMLGLGLAAAGASYYDWCQGASGSREPLTVRIPQGATGDEIVSMLHERGVIRCGLVSRVVLSSRGQSDTLLAGEYDLTTNMRLEEVVAVLQTPPPPLPTVTVTIPEGYRITQIAERARRDLGVPADRFVSAAGSGRYSLPPYLPKGTPTTEGFLFPKTYEFLKGQATADELIRAELHQFAEEVQGLPWRSADRLGVTPYEVVIVASMIEKEAKLPGERAKVAAVIYNRLRRKMPLGIDATLLYDDPTPGDNELSASDLRHHSPYNTRLHPGLPPTPIANPGLPSIEAALRPAHVRFLYYVLCGNDGHHAFSSTYDLFLRDRARCHE